MPAGESDSLPLGLIPVDAIFTPVRKVSYAVEHTRVGQLTNYDRLILEAWTDGSLSPVEAMSQAARLLVQQFSFFTELSRPGLRSSDKKPLGAVALPSAQYDMSVDELNLSSRTVNCLKRANLIRVGQVLEASEDDLLAIKNFGTKSLGELRERLRAFGFLPPESAEEGEKDEA